MIKFDNVSLFYGEKKVFKGLCLEIKQGEKVVISGRSGLGKSSLFSLILGFVRPGNGKVFFDDICINEKTAWYMRQKVSFVDQDVSIGVDTVSDWINFVSGFKANSSLDFGKKRVTGLMSYFDLDRDLLYKCVSDLSGGERQRIAIVISVLLDRKVFLLDEITSALDKSLKKKVADFFIREKEWTIVVISHDSVWLDNNSVKTFDLGAGKWKL